MKNKECFTLLMKWLVEGTRILKRMQNQSKNVEEP